MRKLGQLAFLLVNVIDAVVQGAVEDTQVVGSSLHQVMVKAPADLLAAGDHSSGHRQRQQKKKGKKDGDKGYLRSQSSKGGQGYSSFDSFHKKDGDKDGYEKHSTFGGKDSGGDGGEYAYSSSYDTRDKDGSASKPKYTTYHYEKKSGTPRKQYSDEGDEMEDDTGETRLLPDFSAIPEDVEVTGPISGPKFQSLGDRSRPQTNGKQRKPRKVIHEGTKSRTKDPQAAATEGDYYYDGEGEEGDESEGDEEGDYYDDYY
ncbi:hypothetical protein LSTR_LSTR008003 [Laodelphax striatellus]|uniref:Uncharacterized protein n=1 Tax=Laodelphax striatellus TaxID=195883 RepID=A0A482WJQ4_LAOST|nr:hypothetical protein LSTR_LSTR008003 [Laodelphax striatellus]